MLGFADRVVVVGENEEGSEEEEHTGTLTEEDMVGMAMGGGGKEGNGGAMRFVGLMSLMDPPR